MPVGSAQGVPPGAALTQMLLMFGTVFVIFYVLVFRPQSKAKKAHKAMVEGLKKNDQVATAGGILGTVVNVKSDVVTLRVDENVRIDLEKSSVTRLIKSHESSG